MYKLVDFLKKKTVLKVKEVQTKNQKKQRRLKFNTKEATNYQKIRMPNSQKLQQPLDQNAPRLW